MTSVHVDHGPMAPGMARLGPAVRTKDGENLLRRIAGTRIRQNGCAAASYAALYANV